MKTALASLSFFLLSSSTVLLADESIRDHEITREDYFTQSYLDDCVFSPGGDFIAFTESRWEDEDSSRNKDLWVVEADTGALTRLTFDAGSESDPQWAPDNETLYFIGHFDKGAAKDKAKPPTDGSAQVWRIRKDGQGLMPVTRVKAKGGIDSFDLSEDGKQLLYTTKKEEKENEWSDLRKEFKDDLTFGHGSNQISELWSLDLTTWRTEKLLEPNRFIREFDLSPDGTKVAMITDPNHLLINHEGKSRVDILTLASGKITSLPDTLWRDEAPSPFGWLESPLWSPGDDHLAFSVAFDGYPSEVFVAEQREDAFHVAKLSRPQEAYAEPTLRWTPRRNSEEKNSLCFIGDYRAASHIYEVPLPQGNSEEFSILTEPDVSIADFDISADGKSVAAIQSGKDYQGEIFLSREGGKWKRITRINSQIDSWKLPHVSRVSWTAPDGTEVEGILELPHGYEPDAPEAKPLPLITAIHGGPTGSDHVSFRYWIYGRTLFAARGYAVLCPNYRGSTGYGDKFLTDLIGRENDIEVADILAGIDAMIDKGIADPKRLGVMGWSNGGYLTNCLIATKRFQAASSGAGVFDMTIQWGEEDTPGHVINYLDGLPWQKPEEYQKASPLYSFTPDIETATLIHVGENDPRVPVTHSRALHRAMRYYVKAPTELIIYPDSGHSLTKYRHRLAKLKWDHAWFDRYLKGE